MSRSLDEAFASLRASFPPGGKEPERAEEKRAEKISTADLLAQKEEAIETLNEWKVAARSAKKKKAEEACDKIIRLIRALCP